MLIRLLVCLLTVTGVSWWAYELAGPWWALGAGVATAIALVIGVAVYALTISGETQGTDFENRK